MLPTPETALKQSIQTPPDAKKDGGLAGNFWAEYARQPVLAPWGTRLRERQLRNLYRHDDSTMIRGAFASIAKIISTTPWEIVGPDTVNTDTAKYYRAVAKAADMPAVAGSTRPDLAYYQQLLRGADFGRGWTSFIEKLVIDYLRQDGGAYVEVIAPGSANTAPKGTVTGLATLDSLRCWPTGDPEYPVVYWNRKGEYHLIPSGRVMQFQDMPDSDEMIPGYGMSALSRAVAIAYREILMNRYIAAQLDDNPPPGVISASGVNDATLQTALLKYRKDQNNADFKPEWGKLLWLFATDPSFPIKLDVMQFNTPPEKFDWKVYSELDVDLLALAIGVDRQDLWQLTGSNIGSKGQGETMAQKSRGKTIGVLRSEIERKLNDLMPDEYEFKWKYKDTQEELERAQIAQAWVDVTSKMSGTASVDELRTIQANTSEVIKDAFSDESGKLLSVGDADVQTAQQMADDARSQADLQRVTALQAASGGTGQQGGTAGAVRPRPGMGNSVGGQRDMDNAKKAIQSTTLDFENDFADLVKSRIDGVITGQRFGILARAMLRNYGMKAFRDGLEDGGVPTTDALGVPTGLELDELATFNAWLIEQSVYVSAFGRTLTKGDTPNADDKASLWANNSIRPIYNAGVMYADKNGMYMWVLGKTEKHCTDCARLDGQVHRYRNWSSRNLVPPTHKTECGGWLCDCKLKKTSLPVSGGY